MKLKKYIWLIAMSAFSFLMWNVVIAYSSFATDIGFLITKQSIIHLDYYRFAFYIHILSSLILMICGGLLFVEFSFAKWWLWHRRLGKVYVVLLLLFAAPSGLILGFYANGGFFAQLNFILLSIIWWGSTYLGYSKVIKKDIISHRKWMVRSYALTLSAITLRALQMLLPIAMIPDQNFRYIIISWCSWIINLLIAEVFIVMKINKKYHTFLPIIAH